MSEINSPPAPLPLAEMSLQMGMPKPKAVVLTHIEEVHSLKPGPMVGKRIG